MDNGEEIICTPDHKFMTREGFYKEAQSLNSQDSLMPLHKRISKIAEILREKGLKIGLIQSRLDRVMPHRRIEEQVIIEGLSKSVKRRWPKKKLVYEIDGNQIRGNVDAYASIASRKAGHDELLIHPERAARAALTMLNQLNTNGVLNP